MARRGIDMAEAERLLGDPVTVEKLQELGDLPLSALHRQEVTVLSPGISSTQLQTGGCDPSREVCGPVSNLQNVLMPSSIVAPNWQGMLREAIDSWFNRGGGEQVPLTQSPIAPGQMPPGWFPTTTTPQLPGVVLNGCAPKPKVQFITMPNGMQGCPSGYHPEKSGQPYCVRNRRMNPLNPRALSRAGRRIGGFARAVKRARTLKKVCKTL